MTSPVARWSQSQLCYVLLVVQIVWCVKASNRNRLLPRRERHGHYDLGEPILWEYMAVYLWVRPQKMPQKELHSQCVKCRELGGRWVKMARWSRCQSRCKVAVGGGPSWSFCSINDGSIPM